MPNSVLPEKYGKVEFPLWLHAIPIPAWRAEVLEDGICPWGAEGATPVEPFQPPPAWGTWPLSGQCPERSLQQSQGVGDGDFPGLGVIPYGAEAFTAL